MLLTVEISLEVPQKVPTWNLSLKKKKPPSNYHSFETWYIHAYCGSIHKKQDLTNQHNQPIDEWTKYTHTQWVSYYVA